MNLIEKATVIHFHRHRIARHGHATVKALGWKGAASQRKRFEALATVGDLNERTLLDIGCGYGDLKGYLDNRFSDFTYIGIDQMPEFVESARNRYADAPNTSFFQTDFTVAPFPSVDYVFASGAMGYRCSDPGFWSALVRKMYAAAGRALAFNMLDATRFPRHPLLVGHDLDKVVAFCASLSPRVEVVRGYLEDDFTIVMHADPDASDIAGHGFR